MPSPVYQRLIRFNPDCAELITRLRSETAQLDRSATFPIDNVRLCARFERLCSFTEHRSTAPYIAMAYGCLTTAFIMTQRSAAIRRIETSNNERAKESVLPCIESGEAFATVGISHLTTSRRHLPTPPVQAHRDGDGWRLQGRVPWVTGGCVADYLVVGAVEWPSSSGLVVPSEVRSGSESSSREEYLFLISCPKIGLHAGAGMELIALTSSCTDGIDFDGVRVTREDILHGPSDNVMAASHAGGAGGLHTSALAMGLAASAIDYLYEEAMVRPSLRLYADKLIGNWLKLLDELDALEDGVTGSASLFDSNSMRKMANDLALHSTQSAMAVAKGAGFMREHPVGRWCSEALFFLVWSCPQGVAEAHLCSMTHIDSPWLE
ncbi:MAG: acyl-CoA dehydrogenase family protein [Planctomycetota bacterium]